MQRCIAALLKNGFLSTTAAPSPEPLARYAPALITQPQQENSSSARP
jgi:hypothetical protein